jgi:hypothetical protein
VSLKITQVYQIIFFVLLVLAMTFIKLPGDTRFIGELQNTGHIFAFGVAATVSLKLMQNAKNAVVQHAFYQYIVTFFLCLSAGVLVELLQLITYSDADVYDVVRDIIGAVSFLGFCFLIDKGLLFQLGEKKRQIQLTVGVFSVAALLVGLAPLARTVIDYCQRYRAFPVVIDFNSSWVYEFLTTNHSRLQVVEPPVYWEHAPGKKVAYVKLDKARYPGFNFDEPQPDWSGYSFLNFQTYSKNTDMVKLTIRVHDKKHNQQYNDRFNYSIDIGYGEKLVHIPLRNIKTAPTDRAMNMKEIAGLMLFAEPLEKPVEFYLSNIWLD